MCEVFRFSLYLLDVLTVREQKAIINETENVNIVGFSDISPTWVVRVTRDSPTSHFHAHKHMHLFY